MPSNALDLDAARDQISDMIHCYDGSNLNLVPAALGTLDTLVARVRELEADAKRLDWITDNAVAIMPNLALDDDGWPAWSVHPAGLETVRHDILRRAIDAAIDAERAE